MSYIGEKRAALVVAIAISGAASSALFAKTDTNRFQGIVERNLFGLKEPSPSTPPPADLHLPKIILTGFTTILGDKRVLFKVQEPAKPPAPAKEEAFMLTEGQREADIEVLTIDEKAERVKVNNHGVVEVLDMANNGAKPPPSTQPLSPTGIPRIQPGLNPPRRVIPTRTTAVSVPAPQTSPPTALPGMTSPPQPSPAATTGQPPLTPEEQAILIELERLRNQNDGNPLPNTMPPIPQSGVQSPQ